MKLLTKTRVALLSVAGAGAFAATAFAASHVYFDYNAGSGALTDSGAQSGIHALQYSHGTVYALGRPVCVSARDQYGNQINPVVCDDANPVVRPYYGQTARAWARAAMGSNAKAKLRSEW